MRGAPVDPSERTLNQPDGKTFKARAFGDARRNGMVTGSGYEIVQDGAGRWVYVDGADREGDAKASTRVVGRQAPPVGAGGDVVGTENDTGTRLAVPPNGTGAQPAVVILVEFTDQPSIGSSPGQWHDKYFGPSDSVRDFYLQASFGEFDFVPAAESHGTVGDGVVGWVQLPYAHPNYGGDLDATSGDGVIWESKVTSDAIVAADPYLDYAAFDSDDDGFISPWELHITVIVAGYEAALSGACSPSVWGHQSSLPSEYTPELDGTWVGMIGYTQFAEWHRSCTTGGVGQMATIGIMAHEIGHDLGLPDLYDILPSSSPDSAGIGDWSLMASGSHNSKVVAGDSPAMPDAWSKYLLGWISPTQVSAETSVELRSAALNPDAVRLLDDPGGPDWAFGQSGTGEYFLVENREQVGYDVALPGCGLLIWHIDETRPGDNTANAQRSRRLVDLEEADGLNELDDFSSLGDPGDPYPGSKNNHAFNSGTNPNSLLYDNTDSGVSVAVSSTACAPTMTATMSVAEVGGIPVNDNFASATPLAGGQGSVTGRNVNATKEPGEPAHAANAGGKSLWYSWTAPAAGNLSVTTSGSTFDTSLGLYQGSSVDALTERASNDDENFDARIYTSRIAKLPVSRGQVYRIAVDGYSASGGGTASGTVRLSWSFAPANDFFATATALSGSSGVVTGWTAAATKEFGEPAHAGNVGGKSVWYNWTAPDNGKVTLSTSGSTFDTILGVYQGSLVNALTQRASNDDENFDAGIYTSRIANLTVARGQVYRIAVDGFREAPGDAESGTVTLGWSFTPFVRVSVKAVNSGSKLYVNVDPNKGSGYWRFTVQRLSSGVWRSVSTYSTYGSTETRTIDLKKGTYRVVVAGKYGYLGATSGTATLRR